MGFFDRIRKGLSVSQASFKERMNIMLDRGPDLDEEFWENLEEMLILSDMGAQAADDIVESLREDAAKQALPDAWAVLDLLSEKIAESFTVAEENVFDHDPQLVLLVGVNGSGKTTTVGKVAAAYTERGRKVLMGSADTFRAAAIEQLEVWSKRAGVEIVSRERGSDPASVCYETIERAEQTGADLVLIDTAGRLHTSDDLMRELQKVVSVVRKRSAMPVATLLVIDATTGQNGLQQAREFNRALDLDGVIITKLDGTAKGGIAIAVSHELELPIYKIGVGEGIDDLQDFDAMSFAKALIGDFDERDLEEGAQPEDFAESAEAAATPEPAAADAAADGESAETVETTDGHDVSQTFTDAAETSDDAVGASAAELQGAEELADGSLLEPEESVGAQEEESGSEDGSETGTESAEDAEGRSEDSEEPEEEPRKKKHFWERWF